MSLSSLFGFKSEETSANNALANLFPFPIRTADFISVDLENLYSRILTDVLERTEGIPAKMQPLLWDNCLASESAEGLVTRLSKGMVDKREIFLVYNKATNVVTVATADQEEQIKDAYRPCPLRV